MPGSILLKFLPSSDAHKRKRELTWGRELGRGAYGTVSLCTWERRNHPQEVAVKVVPKRKILRPQPEWKRGIEWLKALNHPHVVKLFDYFESKAHYYVIMELAAGGELYDRVEQAGHFSEDEARPMIRDLCSATQYIHSKGILHRDIKLENMFVRGKGGPPFDCVLADFGVCHQFKWDTDWHDTKLTQPVGSAGYVAPEVVLAEEMGYGRPADVFSVGVVAFILLGGRFPFRATMSKDFVDHARQGLKFPKKPWDAASPGVKDFLSRLLEFNPAKRATLDDALKHPWLNPGSQPVENGVPPTPDTRTPVEQLHTPPLEAEDDDDDDGKRPRLSLTKVPTAASQDSRYK